MLKGLRQLLLGDRRANKRACRQPARGSRKPESFRWCAPALGEPRRPAVGSRGARTGKLAPQGGERRPPGLPTLGRVGSMTVRPLPPPLPAELLSSSLPPLSPCEFAGGSVSLSPAHFPLFLPSPGPLTHLQRSHLTLSCSGAGFGDTSPP